MRRLPLAHDSRTPIDQQIRFHDQIEAAGHHVVNATDEMKHGTMNATIPAAGACLNDWKDDRIVAFVRPKKGLQMKTANAK